MAKIWQVACVAFLIAAPGYTQDSADQRASQSAPFVIGIEDVLRIVTWGEEDLTLIAKVRPDGKITMPLVNEVQAAGLTPEEMRQRITEKMQEYVRAPNVTVIVEEINNFRVYFLGEINTQGPVQFYRPTRLLQAIATAGGLTEFSDKKITVLRDEFGMERRIEVDYKKLWAGDPGQENLYLSPGDTILVR